MKKNQTAIDSIAKEKWENKIKNAIKTCRKINAQWFMEARKSNLNLLFNYDGSDVNMGIDSYYSLQISNFQIYSKHNVIEQLKYLIK